MSLKSVLQNRIYANAGEVLPYDEVVKICQEMGYKPSNAERRLRASESPDIETVYHPKGYIVGYKKKLVKPIQQVLELRVDYGV